VQNELGPDAVVSSRLLPVSADAKADAVDAREARETAKAAAAAATG
jgi:hypothetical protein